MQMTEKVKWVECFLKTADKIESGAQQQPNNHE